jgi:hypothetical protein
MTTALRMRLRKAIGYSIVCGYLVVDFVLYKIIRISVVSAVLIDVPITVLALVLAGLFLKDRDHDEA